MSGRTFHLSELDGVGDGAGWTDLLAMARELERLDGGAIRPSDGFTDRVLVAIGSEPLPRPMAVAGVAAREGRLGTMLAALRDTWHVAWSGGRPLAVRAQAMAFVLLLIVALGSVGGLATVGAVSALFPPSNPPSNPPSLQPTPGPQREASPSVEPTDTPPPAAPIVAPTPTEKSEPTGTPEPGKTPEPQKTPGHTERPGNTETPRPDDTPDPSDDGHGGGDGSGDSQP